jgi:high affinity sulfate transporter 1
VPGISTARTYERSWLRGDIVAGLVLSALLVPQGMAYAELAGLPAVTGLYTTVMALLAYAVFGPSRNLVLGPDSALGPLILAAIVPLVGSDGDPERAIALGSMMALLMGLICLVAGLARLGTVAELLSKPVRIGYINGIAIVVVISQLPKLCGFGVDATTTVGEAREWVRGVMDGDTNLTALAIGLACLAIILGGKRIDARFPGVLVAVVGATLAVSLFDLTEHGITVVGVVPSGFPRPSFPSVGLDDLGPLLVGALGVAFVTLTDTTAMSRTFARMVGDDVDPNQEIAALGTANLAAGVFRGFPVSASSSRTAVAFSAGARSQLTGVVGAAVIVLVLVAFNGLVQNMPDAALAAVVVTAGVTLFDFGEVRWLWSVRRSEFWLSAAALVGVVAVGVLEGIVIAIALSLANFIWKAWRPYSAVLGRIADRKGYHDIERHPEGLQIPGLVLYRFDAPLFFANADHFDRRVAAIIAEQPGRVRWVIIAAEPITDIDTTGAEVLADMLDDFERDGVVLAFAELKGPVKDRLRRYGLYDRIGDGRFFPTLGTAIDGYVMASGVAWDDPWDRAEVEAEAQARAEAEARAVGEAHAAADAEAEGGAERAQAADRQPPSDHAGGP